jgi:tetratricopeptide (TPR) repeat protein
MMILAMGALLLSAVWFIYRSRVPPGFDPIVPENMSGLEPDVKSLIERLIAHAKNHPREASAHGELGLAYEANRMWREGKQSFEHAVKLDSTNRLWRLHLAITTQETGDFARVSEILSRLAQDDPDFPAVQHRLGKVLLQTGDLPGAAAAFERTIALAPRNADGYVGRAEVCLQQQETNQAIQLLRTGISYDPSFAIAHHLLGQALQAQGKTQQAAVELRLGQRAKTRYLADPLSPRVSQYAVSAFARNDRGKQLLGTGQYAAAAREFELILRSEPNNTTALNHLANAYHNMKKSEQAFKLLEKARRIDDRKYLTYHNLAVWASDNRRFDEALAYAKAAVERAPRTVEPYIVQALVLQKLNRSREAKELLLQTRDKIPQDERIESLLQRLE